MFIIHEIRMRYHQDLGQESNFKFGILKKTGLRLNMV